VENLLHASSIKVRVPGTLKPSLDDDDRVSDPTNDSPLHSSEHTYQC
jgi:hypothetical protein